MKDLTKGSITKLIFWFALPVFIGSLLQMTYNLVDTKIIGYVLGESSLAAVGSTNSVNTLVIGFLQGLTNGFAVIAELAKKYDAYVVTDEVYEHIVYAPNKHIYMQSLEGMRERTIVCNSLSKTYSITGWRLGYVIANPQIIDRVKKVHDFLTVGAAAPLMEAAVVGLEFGDF